MTSLLTPTPPAPSSIRSQAERALQTFTKTVLANPFIPHRPHNKQALFLLHDDTREALYGGAAGGGKTDALLMAALQYAHVPGYNALLLMPTFADLNLPKAGASRAKEWLSGTGAALRDGCTWHFPSGATLTFGYLQSAGDEERYRTAEFHFVAFDELTRFTQYQYLYLFSRLRRLAGTDIPSRMRAATNPGGKGHEWVRKRFVPEAYLQGRPEERFSRVWWTTGSERRSGKDVPYERLFVPARKGDNPTLDQEDYDASLANLPPVLRARLEDGDWSAHEGGHFQTEWFKTFRDGGDHWYVFHTQEMARKVECPVVCTVDPAGGVSQSAKFTAIGVGALTPGGTLLITEVVRERLPVEEIVPRLADVCRRWRPMLVGIEDGFLQSAYIREARRTQGIPTVEALAPEGKSKLVRATPAIKRAAYGGIALPEGAPWREDFVAELAAFTGDDKLDAYTDQVDVLAWCVSVIDRFGLGGHDEGPVVLGRRWGR